MEEGVGEEAAIVGGTGEERLGVMKAAMRSEAVVVTGGQGAAATEGTKVCLVMAVFARSDSLLSYGSAFTPQTRGKRESFGDA